MLILTCAGLIDDRGFAMLNIEMVVVGELEGGEGREGSEGVEWEWEWEVWERDNWLGRTRRLGRVDLAEEEKQWPGVGLIDVLRCWEIQVTVYYADRTGQDRMG